MSNEILDNLEIEENRLLDPKELKKLYTLKMIAVIQTITAIIATFLEFEETETIIGSGPVGSILGAFLVSRAIKMSPFFGKELAGQFLSFRTIAMTIGLSAPLFSLFWLLMIVSFNWNPKEAQMPVFIGLCAYTAFLFFATRLLFGAYKAKVED